MFLKVSSATLYMPVWSHQELRLIPNLNKNWEYYYELIGGVLRTLLLTDFDIMSKLDDIDEDVRGDIIYEKYIANKSFKNIDLNKSYSFVHINPKESNGKFEYLIKETCFATDIIKTMLHSKYLNNLRNINPMLLNSDELDNFKKRPSISKEFESYLNNSLTIGKEFDIPCLYHKDNQLNNLKLKIEHSIVEMPRGHIFLKDEIYNVIVPKSKTFTSVDSFYSKKINGKHILYFFQMTTANTL